MPRTKKATTEIDSKKTITQKQKWPKIIEGSHSTRIEHENGLVEFTTHWEKLERDVKQALRSFDGVK